MSPKDYGKLRSISPQLVYYHVREGNLDKHSCQCGNTLIDVAQADKQFKIKLDTEAADD
jgi:hypothetical protein